jgi:lipopolysaccharide transport system ATP-binding protein
MNNLAIKAENISKQYRLGKIGTGTLSHDLNRWWHAVRGKEDPFLKIGDTNDRTVKGESDYVWSLKDINFEINAGDAVGIIGRNGAGKSTLLKLLSKVTKPTTGNFKINGRIASLLEVGTGFHPEMTGRENVYLNGAILGMTKKEISRKFDEIVAFSGVDRYIDTPVKRYSSGMYVRLAFAVAAHLESEILIIDEVLAVGDVDFQKKCLGKMGDISKGEGRTVLFVSHNMAAVKTLCQKGIVLEHGRKVFEGNSTGAVSYYLKGDSETQNKKTFGKDYDTPIFTLHEIYLNNISKLTDDPLSEDKEIELTTSVTINTPNTNKYYITYHLYNELGEALFSFSHGTEDFALKNGINTLVCTFPKYFFQSGTFMLSLFIVQDKKTPVFIEKDIITFTVVDGEREMGIYLGREPGFIRPSFNWKLL